VELLLILGMHGNGCDYHAWQFLGVAKLFPCVVIHYAMHNFLVLLWEEFHGALLKILYVCEVTVDALVSNSCSTSTSIDICMQLLLLVVCSLMNNKKTLFRLELFLIVTLVCD